MSQQKLAQDKAKLRRKTIRVRISCNQVVEGSNHFDTHRELVAFMFNKAGYVVISYSDLKYFYGRDHVIVEGVTNVSLLSGYEESDREKRKRELLNSRP